MDDTNDLNRCSKCAILSLKSKFHKDKTKNDELKSNCKVCRKNYQKKYNVQNKEMRNLYIKKRIKTDVNFGSIHNIRRRTHHALKGKVKSSSTIDILGIGTITYKKWIEFQMNPEMNWGKFEVDHVKAIFLIDVSKDEELKEAFN